MNFKNKKIFSLLAVIILIVTLLFSCSGGKKRVALDFAEAYAKDFNAKKMVSLMSEDYKKDYMEKMDAGTEKILISKMKEKFKTVEEKYEDRYGKHWKVKIEYIDSYKLEEKMVAVSLNVTFKGKGGFLDMTDKENTEELTVLLTKERGKWKVCDMDS